MDVVLNVRLKKVVEGSSCVVVLVQKARYVRRKDCFLFALVLKNLRNVQLTRIAVTIMLVME